MCDLFVRFFGFLFFVVYGIGIVCFFSEVVLFFGENFGGELLCLIGIVGFVVI